MKSKGFTLIELLVAIGVLALVAVLGWRGLDGIIRARVALTSQLEQTRGMQLTFAQIESDCANVAPLTVLGDRPQLIADGERLRLVRTVFADDQPSQLEVVVYRLNNGVLSRRESTATRDLKALDALWTLTADDTADVQPVILQSGVASMAMRLWAGSGPWQEADAVNAMPTSGAAAAGAAQGGSSTVLKGLEVSLQVQDSASVMRKVFLVGPV
jgi:general secretion pathway protein J